MYDEFQEKGWVRFAHDPAILDWANAAHAEGLKAVEDPAYAPWIKCEGTWFVGVDALPNDADGALGGVALSGAPVAAIRSLFDIMPPLHRGQLSIMYPGYPRPRDGEGEAAFRYRVKRDAAHVDGLRIEGPDRARMIKEPHEFVLGIPLNTANEAASPLVVWEGSHHIMRAALAEALEGHPPETWGDVDITAPYQAARRVVFETCPRVVVTARPGESYLMHRHCLHGIAPWGDSAVAPPEGRMIAYFRPEMAGGVPAWLKS